MKSNQLYEQLTDLAKQLGITIRKERGNFKSGYCVLNEQNIIILNKTGSPEILAASLARSLSQFDLNKVYIKPALREYIEKESLNIKTPVEIVADEEPGS